LDAGAVIGAGGEVGAEEEEVVGAHRGNNGVERLVSLEVGKHSEECEKALGVFGRFGKKGVDGLGKVFGAGEIEDEGLDRDAIAHAEAGDEGERGADVSANIDFGVMEMFEQGGIFLSAAATEGDKRKGIFGKHGGGVAEGDFVGVEAVRIGPRGGKSFVDREPELGLAFGVVMELVIHAARAKGFEIGGAGATGEARGIDSDEKGMGLNRHGLTI